MAGVDLSKAPLLEPGDVPLPPEGADGEAVSIPKPPLVAALDFLDPAALSKTVPLDFPFRWEGREVREIVVRRLAVAEIGAVVAKIGDTPDLFAFYAAMTGFPPEVLRGLRDEAVIEACTPFLPQLARALFFSPTPDAGGDSP